MLPIDIQEKLGQINEHWSPHVIAELNGQHVKLAKLEGEFTWHKHVDEDELFYILKGELEMQFRDKTEILNEGQMIVIPKGVEHRPVAKEEVWTLLFEPASTLNTGDQINEFTKSDLKKL